MIRKFLLLTFLLALAVACVAAAGGYWTWTTLNHPFPAEESFSKTVEIAPGTSARAILDQLEKVGVLKNSTVARLYLVKVLEDPSLKAGEYLFEGKRSTPEVLDKLIAGQVVTYPLTIIEGLTAAETADAISKAGFGDLEELLRIVSSPELVADIDAEARDLEGYLLPDTYAFARNTSEETIIKTMVESFRERALPILETSKTSIRHLVTLASIVEKEARLDEERPIIAGVYSNRLRIGMGLYADPTLIYGLKKRGLWDGNLKRSHLIEDTPYNTYVVPGLPPSPICSPGLASLEAAAKPADVPYLYFVSRNNGSHVFAETLSQHNRNVNEWQRQYWRDRRKQ